MYRCLFVLALLLVGPSLGRAELDSQLQARIKQVKGELRSAGSLYAKEDYAGAATLLSFVKAELGKLPQTPEVAEATESLAKSFGKAEELLGKKGIKIPKFDPRKFAEFKNRSKNPEGKTTTVSFASDVAEIFANRCPKCHGERSPRAGFSLTSYASLMKGGTQPVIVPGNPRGSLLMGKILGEAPGKQMPIGQPALSADQIKAIETWIGEGAQFDGPDPEMSLESLAEKGDSLAQASEVRADAEKNWKLAFPKDAPVILETEQFLLLSKLSQSELEPIGAAAQQSLARVARVLNLSNSKSTRDTKIPIFILPKPYDYREFTKMVEKRQQPSDPHGHWVFDRRSGYIVLGPPGGRDELQLQTKLDIYTTGILVSRLGVPRWFADGLGLVFAEQFNRRDHALRTMKGQIPQALAAVPNPRALISDQLGPQVSKLASWGFVAYLMSNRQRMVSMFNALQQEMLFETAFGSAYGAPAEVVCTNWLRQLGALRQR